MDKYAQSSHFGGIPPAGALTANDVVSAMGPDVQIVTPTTGQTVQVADNNHDTTLILNPAGDLAALTIAFPSNANSRIGQTITVRSRRNIVAVSMTGPTSILGTVSTFVTDNAVQYCKTSAAASGTWEKVVA